jgi:adenine-specific DNA-methyltransferase
MTKTHARAMRKNPTDAERVLWKALRFRQAGGHKFRRQMAMGPYILDFVCLEKKLVVEVDGGQHLEQSVVKHDAERAQWLQAQGFRLLRFWNDEVLKETEAVMQRIWSELNAPHPALPHKGGGK